MKYLKKYPHVLESDNVMMSKSNRFVSSCILREGGVEDTDGEILRLVLSIDKTVDKQYSPFIAAFYAAKVHISDLDIIFGGRYDMVLEDCRLSFDKQQLKVNFSDGRNIIYDFTEEGFNKLLSDFENESLNYSNNGLSWFSMLPKIKKGEYIKKGNLLTDEQFDALL